MQVHTKQRLIRKHEKQFNITKQNKICVCVCVSVCRCSRFPRSCCRGTKSTRRSKLRCLPIFSSSPTCHCLTSLWTKVGHDKKHIHTHTHPHTQRHCCSMQFLAIRPPTGLLCLFICVCMCVSVCVCVCWGALSLSAV